MMQGVPAGPPRVQIQTQAGCNGRCVFCPNEQIIAAGLPQGKMSEALFEKIIGDLERIPPRRIGLYLMNEPLLDDRLPGFVRYVSQRIPSAKTQVISNGRLLTQDCMAALIDAGLKQLKVSLQSLDPVTNERLMGYRSEKVIENCVAAQRIIREKRARDLSFRISMIVTNLNADEIAEARRFWNAHGIRLVTSALENRGGNIAAAGDLNPHEMQHMDDCLRPSRDMMILYNGDCPLCCVDWFRTTIVGNVSEQSVQEVWLGPKLEAIRDALRENRVEALPDICRHCSESACPDHHRRGLKGFLSRVSGWAVSAGLLPSRPAPEGEPPHEGCSCGRENDGDGPKK